MSVEQHRQYALDGLGFAVVTVSDSRTAQDDTSGDLIRHRVVEAGHRVESSALVADEVAAIRTAAKEALGWSTVDVLVTTGGTGFSPRDRTLEALEPLWDRPIEGFGELFRMLSYHQVAAAAMLSRAAAGLVGTKALFALPGSPKAVDLALEKLILPEAGHLLAQARR